jgi:iduronate 2-sulfatase
MKIRPIASSDREQWLRMRRALWPDCPEDRHLLEMEQLRSARNAGVVLVAERDDVSVCGFAEISVRHDHVDGATSAPVAYLEGWYVDEDCRGQGLGRELIAAAERWAAKQGFSELASDAELENEPSIRAHASLGFRETGRTVHFIKRISAIIAAACVIFSFSGRAAETPDRLNVLMIIADDLRPELACYGERHIHSPNIDRLAKRGLRFDRAYCQYPVCNPSRVSFLTGRRPSTTGVLDNGVHFRKLMPDVVTLPQLFRRNGYFTASLGKVFHRGLTMEDLRPEMDDTNSWDLAKYFQATPTGLRGEGRNLTGGKLAWCRWLAADGDDDDQPDGQIAQEAIRLLRDKRNGAFFLAIGFHKPHDPFNAPKKYFEHYPLASLKLHNDPTNAVSDPPLAIGSGWKDQFARFTDQERREYSRAYYACVSFMDAQVGKVLDELDRLKLWDKTVVVFLGDHGFHLGERGWWNKSTLFELSARVPFIVWSPKMKAAGKSTSRLVELVDIFPTMIELCRIEAPGKLEGKSFLPLLDSPTQTWKEAAFTQVQRGKVAGHSARSERYRYTEWDGGKQGAELYDHDRDPDERNNLVNDPQHGEIVSRLKQLLP